MVDQINESIDVVVRWMDEKVRKDDDDEEPMIVNIAAIKANERPLYQITQKRHIETIPRELEERNRVLLQAYNTYAYYSCAKTEMQQKVLDHMTTTGAYSLILELNDSNQHFIEKVVKKMGKRITLTLDKLLTAQLITFSHYNKMKMNQSKRRLDCLYFLPDTRRKDIPFQPITVCHYGLTNQISRFLRHLLQTIYDRVTHSMTFNTGADAIDAVEAYTAKGFLRATKLFATVHIKDLCAIFPHDQSIEALERFLRQYVQKGNVQYITIPTIIQLAQLFLGNQYYLYENAIYQQIRGGGLKSPLTTLLANIYLYYCLESFIEILNHKTEVFGRSLDVMFMTWNESEETLRDKLNQIHIQYPHLKMTISIGKTIHYLDAELSQMDGALRTNVAKNVDTEPYSLPFVFGHRKNKFQTLLRASLVRAARCCANVFDFANEWEDLQLSFQCNRFSNDYIIYQIQSFFEEFHVDDLQIHPGESYYNQTLYENLRCNTHTYHQRQKPAHILSERWRLSS